MANEPPSDSEDHAAEWRSMVLGPEDYVPRPAKDRLEAPPTDSAWSVLNEQARSPWKRGQQVTPNRLTEPPFNSDAVTTLAWLMWCFQQGYKTAEDRAIMENWMGEHQDNAEDESTRQALLEMATEILTVWRSERG